MEQIIETKFNCIVRQIFNNWSALQLAVEHEMGGPTSRQTAIDIMNWISAYCLDRPNIESNELTEVLEDVLDEEFSTICEDESPKEVAHLLIKFLDLLRQGQMEQFDIELSKLPSANVWLLERQQQANISQNNEQEEEIDENKTEMEVDPEWTVVHNRRKK